MSFTWIFIFRTFAEGHANFDYDVLRGFEEEGPEGEMAFCLVEETFGSLHSYSMIGNKKYVTAGSRRSGQFGEQSSSRPGRWSASCPSSALASMTLTAMVQTVRHGPFGCMGGNDHEHEHGAAA